MAFALEQFPVDPSDSETLERLVPSESDRLRCVVDALLDRCARTAMAGWVLRHWAQHVIEARQSRSSAFFDAMGFQLRCAQRRCAMLEEEPTNDQMTFRNAVFAWRSAIVLARTMRSRMDYAEMLSQRFCDEMSLVTLSRSFAEWRRLAMEACKENIVETDRPMRASGSPIKPKSNIKQRFAGVGVNAIPQLPLFALSKNPNARAKSAEGRNIGVRRRCDTDPKQYAFASANQRHRRGTCQGVSAADSDCPSSLPHQPSSGRLSPWSGSTTSHPGRPRISLGSRQASPAKALATQENGGGAWDLQCTSRSSFETCQSARGPGDRYASPASSDQLAVAWSPCSSVARHPSYAPRWSDVEPAQPAQETRNSGFMEIDLSTLPRGPEKFFYDTARYTGCARFGGPTIIDRRIGPSSGERQRSAKLCDISRSSDTSVQTTARAVKGGPDRRRSQPNILSVR